MATLNIEQKIETSWITTLSADTYITTNSIPVYGYRDVNHARPQKCVVVKAGQAECVNGALGTPGVIFKCEVEIFAVSYTPDDKTRSTLEAIYQSIIGTINGTTKATLTTNATSGITFAGVEHTGGSEGTEDHIQYLTAKITCTVYK